MTVDLLQPLGPEDLERINEALAQIDVLDQAIAKAERADINVSESKKIVEDAQVKLLRLKQVYFPGE